MNILFYVSDTHCCGHVRGEELARVINKDASRNSMIAKSDILSSDFAWADVMVFQRQMTTSVLEKMELANKYGIKTIYDIDDMLLEIPESLGETHDALATPEIKRVIKLFLQNADIITTASVDLAHAVRRYCKTPIYILKNGVCVEDWTAVPHADDGKTTIGWMGSRTHLADVSIVSGALHRIMLDTDAHLKLIGWVGFGEFEWLKDFEDRIHEEGWVEVNSLPYSMADIDIGIAPIQDIPFNRCKSSIKWMQYSAMGIPTVASNCPPYTDDVEHGRTGMLATTEDEWYDCLKALVVDEGARNTIGKNAVMEVLGKHRTALRAEELVAVCEGLR